MFTKKFWRDASERAIRAVAGTLMLFIGAEQFDVWTADYRAVLGAVAVAAVLSFCTSLVGEKVSPNETGSFLR